jgi:hypothetical protein
MLKSNSVKLQEKINKIKTDEKRKSELILSREPFSFNYPENPY